MNSHEFGIRIWNIEDKIHIKLIHDTSADITTMSTVNENESSKRDHPHLYKQLKAILQAEGKWRIHGV